MFNHIPTYAGDPILSLMDAYQKDPRAHKVNLSIGLYYDEQQQVPQLQAIQQAYADLDTQLKQVKLYLPMSGLQRFNQASQQLIFSTADPAALDRIATVQSLGGSGALKLAADFIHQFFRTVSYGSAIQLGKITSVFLLPQVSTVILILIMMPARKA